MSRIFQSNLNFKLILKIIKYIWQEGLDLRKLLNIQFLKYYPMIFRNIPFKRKKSILNLCLSEKCYYGCQASERQCCALREVIAALFIGEDWKSEVSACLET